MLVVMFKKLQKLKEIIMSTNTKSHAEVELEVLAGTTPDALVAPFRKEILALCEAFDKSGQSGGSAPYTAHALSDAVENLCLQQTISPLTGNDDEWSDVSRLTPGETLFQNKRDGRVFKRGVDESSWFLDAIIFDGDSGHSFSGSVSLNDGSKINSRQHIKSFPFTPKTFRIGVTDHRWGSKEEKVTDPDGDWWTYTIKDESQLKEVFEYYDKY